MIERPLRIGTFCTGIHAPGLAYERLGWRDVFFSEIEPFCCEVLRIRYPDVRNLGDMLAVDGREYRGKVDGLIAGTPCQAFSVAGLRGSLDDDRANLTLAFVGLVHEIDPVFVVWENVPGVLSTKDNAFGCFLAGLVGEREPLASGLERGRWPNAGVVIGPRRTLAWRVLDAQYFGLAQRRRRVFVVSFRTRDRLNPGAVLLEPESLPGDPPSREGKEERVTATLAPGAHPGGCTGRDAENGALVAHGLTSHHGRNAGEDTYVAAPLRAQGQSAHAEDLETYIAQCHGSNVGPIGALRKGNGNVTGGVPFGIFSHDSCAKQRHAKETEVSAAIDGQGGYSTGQGGTAVAFSCKDHGADAGDVSPTLRAMNHADSHANGGGQVAVAAPDLRGRRLTPRECERLQGFPDDFTLIPWRGKPAEACPDSPRYRCLGNSMAVRCMRWICERLDRVLQAARGAT